MLNILHISNSYASQKLYRNLLINLDKYGVRQFMYAPVRRKEMLEENRIYGHERIQFKYSYILRKYHRLLFQRRIKAIVNDISTVPFLKQTNLVHAHFLFSDGAVALKLKERFGIPYVVSVRNTDVNLYFRFMKHLSALGNCILEEAAAIILVTPKYADLLLERYIDKKNRESSRHKIRIIPNGINDFWFENTNSTGRVLGETIKLLFVGKFDRGKNIGSIIDAVKRIEAEKKRVHLTLVGGGGNNDCKIKKMVAKNQHLVDFLGKINDKRRLLEIYRAHDIFIMPSFHETFGLVYIEAISQGVPCIYTKGQGIDGYFKDGEIGYPVHPKDVKGIIEKIILITKRYSELSTACLSSLDEFHWDRISRNLINTYHSATETG